MSGTTVTKPTKMILIMILHLAVNKHDESLIDHFYALIQNANSKKSMLTQLQ